MCKFIDTLKSIVEAIKNYLKNGDVNHRIAAQLAQDVEALEQYEKLWVDALKAAVKNNAEMQSNAKENTDTESSGGKYSIEESITDEEGNVYKNVVKINADIFEGIKPREWSVKLSEFIDNNLIGSEIPVLDEYGNEEIIEFAKPRDRVTKEGKIKSRRAIDKLKTKRDNNSKLVIVNLEEIIPVSTFDGKSDENTHQWLDEKGWEYRTAYVLMKDARLYSVTLNIAKTKDGRNVLYDVNRIYKIKEIGQASLLSETVENNNLAGSPYSDFNGSITRPYEVVKGESKKSLSETDSDVAKYFFDKLRHCVCSALDIAKI